MTSNALTHLRRANPYPTVHRSDPKLFQQIVQSPGDDRLPVSSRWGWITPRRTVAVVALIAISTGAAWVTLTRPSPPPSPLEAFRQNLAASGAPNPIDHQLVVPSTVLLAATASIPHYGNVEYWAATSRPHGICWGLRAPNHTWLGLPGCLPLQTWDTGSRTILVIGEGDVFRGNIDWRIWYGYVRPQQSAVRITDLVSGRSAPVSNGKYFALVIPDTTPHTITFRLVAYDRYGRAVASFQQLN